MGGKTETKGINGAKVERSPYTEKSGLGHPFLSEKFILAAMPTHFDVETHVLGSTNFFKNVKAIWMKNGSLNKRIRRKGRNVRGL